MALAALVPRPVRMIRPLRSAAPAKPARPRWAPAVLGLGVLSAAPPSLAQGGREVRAIDPFAVHGVVRPGRDAGQTWRAIAGTLLFLPRKLEDLIFRAHVLGAHLVRDEHIVSRVDELFSPKPGAVTIFPTLFFASRQPPSAGVRILARGDHVATSLAAGIGGLRDITVDNRIRVSWARPIELAVDTEGLADSRSRLVYAGVGQAPATDDRNHFRAGDGPRQAIYLERRTRGILALSVRPRRALELVASGSYTMSRVSDADNALPSGIDRVFERGTVPGAGSTTRIFYGEATARLDTRPLIGRPTPGALLSLYAGVGAGTGDDPTRFFRVGGRAAVFLPIVRRSNILSLTLAADGIAPRAPGADAIPFTALVSQPEFRGYDTRRDHIGAVISADYRWSLMRFLGARLFIDTASVAPRVGALVSAPPRVAAGFGFDFFGQTKEIGQIAVAFTPEGVRLLLSFGLAPAFRDRQHRD